MFTPVSRALQPSVLQCRARVGVHARAGTTASPGSQAFEFRRRVVSGTPTVGLFLNSASPLVAEQMAALGYDYLVVDAQHSPIDYASMASMLTAASAGARPAVVRVGGPHDRPGIQQALDLGAAGIMVPTVSTADDARRVVDAARLPPHGSRSIAWPVRPQLGRPVGEYLRAVNDEVLVILQVETRESYENVDEVLSVPGVDACFVGPVDLCHAMGLAERHGFPECFESEQFREIGRHVVEACRRHGVAAGNFAVGDARARSMLAQGFTLLATGTDVGLLEGAARQNLEFIRALKAGHS